MTLDELIAELDAAEDEAYHVASDDDENDDPDIDDDDDDDDDDEDSPAGGDIDDDEDLDEDENLDDLEDDDYERMTLAQGGKCALCRNLPGDRRTVNGRAYAQLDVDHCHASQVVRGLLCYNCNAMLGHAHDSVEILEAAIAYLTRQS